MGLRKDIVERIVGYQQQWKHKKEGKEKIVEEKQEQRHSAADRMFKKTGKRRPRTSGKGQTRNKKRNQRLMKGKGRGKDTAL